jgi:hypothetical protein
MGAPQSQFGLGHETRIKCQVVQAMIHYVTENYEIFATLKEWWRPI